jgi:hypothetical protein
MQVYSWQTTHILVLKYQGRPYSWSKIFIELQDFWLFSARTMIMITLYV